MGEMRDQAIDEAMGSLRAEGLTPSPEAVAAAGYHQRVTYRGNNQGDNAMGPHTVVVEVFTAETGCVLVNDLEHHIRHSPTGFSWGYAGSGPADLARSILWDHLEAEPSPSCYQQFKFDFVAKWPQDGDWEITDAEIDKWLKGYTVATGRSVRAENL